MSQALGLPGGEGTSIFPANVIVATVKPKQANKKILFEVFSYYFYFVWYKNAGILCKDKDNNYFRK